MIADGEVQAWFASLDCQTETIERMRALLAPDELERAARFHFDRDRNRYIAGRGMLRRLLGSYVNTVPELLVFRYGEHGKPDLAEPGSPVRFNLSHSHGLALYAFVAGREIGCDVEKLREDVWRDRIADRFFSPAETAALNALPPDQRTLGFFHCWTRKEAWIKARSHGMSIPLDSFDVNLASGDPAPLNGTRPDPAEAARWTIHPLEAPSGFAAAIAVEGPACRIVAAEWSETI